MPRRVSARTLVTKRAVMWELAHRGSPYVLALAIVVPAAIRWSLGSPGPADLVALAIVASAQPLVEWSLHRHLLHAPPRQWGPVRFDPAAAHRGHHRAPDDVGGALLGTPYAIADSIVVALLVGGATLGVSALFGGSPAAALTAVAAAEVGLAVYEWSHLVFHSGHRPRTAWFRDLRARHLAHHHRDERAWFGITSSWVDRRFGTSRDLRAQH
jgi:Fatty acid hydroxylase superfamily